MTSRLLNTFNVKSITDEPLRKLCEDSHKIVCVCVCARARASECVRACLCAHLCVTHITINKSIPSCKFNTRSPRKVSPVFNGIRQHITLSITRNHGTLFLVIQPRPHPYTAFFYNPSQYTQKNPQPAFSN